MYVALAVQLACQMVTSDRKLYDALAGHEIGNHLMWVENVPAMGAQCKEDCHELSTWGGTVPRSDLVVLSVPKRRSGRETSRQDRFELRLLGHGVRFMAEG